MNSSSIADLIIRSLEKGPLPKRDLIEIVRTKNKVTVQGVYKEIRRLLSAEVVLQHKQVLSLNLVYIHKQYNRWNSVLGNYEQASDLRTHFLDLKEGESLTYTFKTLSELDAYWVHASVILDKYNKASTPSYAVIPHDWFLYGRKETDVFWSKNQKSELRLILTHPTNLDKEVLKQRRMSGYKTTIAVNPLKQDESTYYTLMAGYIFKITLKADISKIMRKLLTTYTHVDNIPKVELDRLIYGSGHAVLKIMKDQKKYEKMVARCRKFFE